MEPSERRTSRLSTAKPAIKLTKNITLEYGLEKSYNESKTTVMSTQEVDVT